MQNKPEYLNPNSEVKLSGAQEGFTLAPAPRPLEVPEFKLPNLSSDNSGSLTGQGVANLIRGIGGKNTPTEQPKPQLGTLLGGTNAIMNDQLKDMMYPSPDNKLPQQGPVTTPPTDIDRSAANVLESSQGEPQMANTITNKLKSIVDGVKAVYGDTPQARVAAAQAVLESRLLGSNPSQLAAKYNNYFGIKGRGDAGSVSLSTNEELSGAMQRVNAKFAANTSPEASFYQHMSLMLRMPRYAPFLQASSTEEAINAIARSGYATDSKYGPKLTSVYKQLAPLFGD